jgi:hypothetical protein
LFIFLALLFSAPAFAAGTFVYNDDLVGIKAQTKIEQITNELREKTGVCVMVHARKDLNGTAITPYGQNVAKDLNASSVVVILGVKEEKVDIVSTADVSSLFDKNSVLSDYIIPIIVAPNRDDSAHKYEAALLNGISEIAEEIAASKSTTMFNIVASVIGAKDAATYLPNEGIVLENVLGNTTQNFINLLRILFYAMIALTVLAYLRAKNPDRFKWLDRFWPEKKVTFEKEVD